MIGVDDVVQSDPGGSVRALLRACATIEATATDNAARVDLIGEIETLKCALEAAQAALAHDLLAQTLADHERLGVPRARRGRGVAAQLGLARRTSPHRAESDLGLARAMPVDMPHLYAAWRAGRVTEFRVKTVFSRVVHLDLDDRRAVDADLAGTPALVEAMAHMGDAEARAAADRLAYERDRAAYVKRRAAAEKDRHVSSRPAPDCMVRVSALLGVKEGVAVMAALRAASEAARHQGDPRSGAQLMADTLLERVTGRDPLVEPPPVSVDVAIPLDALVAAGPHADASCWVDGYGAVPADLARSLAADAAKHEGHVRRLFTDAVTGQLVAAESRARIFPAAMAAFLRRRDRFCRTPWCDAPIRHSDHVLPAGEGGPTSLDNGQGLCEACNHAKQAPGWRAKARSDPDGTHVVETTTPTGHTHESRPPPAHPPRRERRQPRPSSEGA